MNLAIREAGVDADLVLKSEMERTTSNINLAKRIYTMP